ncbi:MAG: protein kinase [Myxococcaceae bacterium]
MSFAPGTHIGRYRITRLIAQGGMAEVYRAEQGLTGGIVRPAALKVIRPEYSESPDFREMFLDEARLACTLSHPNIVHIYEVGEAEGRLYMAMELVPGESLAVVSRALRENGERFSLDALIAVGLFTCSALEAVHVLRIPEEGRINLVHRDVSPHNLLLGPGGSLKLIDFGIAKAASNRNLTSPGVTKGKAGYFSPEQAMGKQLDGRSDLFSLGVTLYKLAWGGTPFDQHKTHHERNTALVHGRWVPLRDVCPGLPSGFYDIVDCALQVRPENRFPDAYEMRVALERLAVESGIHVGPSTLSGYVAPQADDPQGLGARGNAPTRSRPSPIVDTQAATVAGANQATAAASPAAPRRQTEKLEARHVLAGARPRPSRRQWLIASGAALVLIAVAAGLWLGKGTFPASGMQVTRESPAVPEPPLQRQQEPERLAVPEPPPATVASSETSKPVARSRSSRPELKRTPRPEPVAAPALPHAPVPAPAVANKPVAQGRGRLRIGGSDDGEISVNGKKWGLSPQDNYVPAGSYSVVVTSLDGARKVSGSVEVRPDQTSIVRFDFEQNSMIVR